MLEPLRQSSQKIQQELDKYGYELKVVEMKESTRTAQEAAATIGCELGQIVKSLVFKGAQTEKPVLVIAGGINRVNEKKPVFNLTPRQLLEMTQGKVVSIKRG